MCQNNKKLLEDLPLDIQGTVWCKQKLNTRSSMETELVAVADTMGQVLWTRYFLAAQWQHVHKTTIYKDNRITIQLAINGRKSSSNTTLHINA